MNLQHVRYFLAVCKQRNFTRAAESCQVRQPSLTAAIQRLEREIGGRLFMRSAPVKLTSLGKELRPLFARMNQTAERAQRIAIQRTRASRGLPRLATTVSVEQRV